MCPIDLVTILFLVTNMTRTSSKHAGRASTKRKHYRPQRINIADLRSKPSADDPPPVIRVQSPFFELMERGVKTVEARPNYPYLRDLRPGTVVEFSHSDGRSFLVRIINRRVHYDFATMLRKETIKDCLPRHDPEDLQSAVNTYHSFRHGTYKFIAKKHRVLALRFTLLDKPEKKIRREYNRNSLCSIFEAVRGTYIPPNKNYGIYKKKIW